MMTPQDDFNTTAVKVLNAQQKQIEHMLDALREVHKALEFISIRLTYLEDMGNV